MKVTRQKSKSWQNYKVAVTGINARAENPGPGCAVARCIQEHTLFKGSIIGLGYDALDAGLYARHLCNNSYLIPYPSEGEEALLYRLAQIHKAEGLDAIIPCLDSELQNFGRLKSELQLMGISMLIPSRDQFNLRAKNHLGTLCESIGVHAPESKSLSNPSFFDSCEKDGWKYPLVVKGIFYDAYIVHSAFEAKSVFAKLVSTWGYPVLVQKLVIGDELNLAAVGDGKGNMLGAVTMRKKALTEKGKAWAGVSIVDEGLTKVAEQIISALSWRGPLEVEVIKGYDGKIYLIEINPRFPSWIYLSHGVGRNLPVAVLKLLSGVSDLEFAEPSSGTFFIRHAQELIVTLPEFETVLTEGRLAPRMVQEQIIRSA